MEGACPDHGSPQPEPRAGGGAPGDRTRAARWAEGLEPGRAGPHLEGRLRAIGDWGGGRRGKEAEPAAEPGRGRAAHGGGLRAARQPAIAPGEPRARGGGVPAHGAAAGG
jgi:hypothetical protein